MQCCSLIEMLLSTTVIPKDKRSNSRKPEKVIQLHNIPTKQRGNWNLEHLLFYFIFQISLQNLKTEVDLCGAFKLICDHSFSLGITRTIIKMTSECDPPISGISLSNAVHKHPGGFYQPTHTPHTLNYQTDHAFKQNSYNTGLSSVLPVF